MADELKDQRVVTMMSPSELKAIDDWMFGERIRSRGEAIRRLCQIGLHAAHVAPELGAQAVLLFEQLDEALDDDLIAAADVPTPEGVGKILQYLLSTDGAAMPFIMKAAELNEVVERLARSKNTANLAGIFEARRSSAESKEARSRLFKEIVASKSKKK